MDLVTYALAKKYVDATLAGAGALQGEPGKSAYELAVEHGYSGSEQDWINSLIGNAGDTPYIGDNGNWFVGDVDTGVKAGAVTSYNDLTNRPTLNGQVIQGDMEIETVSLEELQSITNEYTENIIQQTTDAVNRASQAAATAGNYAAQAIQAKNVVENKFWYGTIEEYNALETINNSTIYIILH